MNFESGFINFGNVFFMVTGNIYVTAVTDSKQEPVPGIANVSQTDRKDPHTVQYLYTSTWFLPKLTTLQTKLYTSLNYQQNIFKKITGTFDYLSIIILASTVWFLIRIIEELCIFNLNLCFQRNAVFL